MIFTETRPTAEERVTNDMMKQNGNIKVINKSATIQPKSSIRSNGNFVVLNKNTLSQFKSVKRVHPTKIKKVFFRGGNVRCFSTTGRLSSIDSRPRAMNGIKTNVPNIQNGKNYEPSLRQHHAQRTNGLSHSVKDVKWNGDSKALTNGDTTPTKSGILIKRKYMKNVTIQKVMRSDKMNGKNDDIQCSKYDSKDDSIKSLIADLEN